MKMCDGKPEDKKEPPKYIYEGRAKNGVIISMPTEEGTIGALKEAGGGLYRNTLHGYGFAV